jgi:hypothetical protein
MNEPAADKQTKEIRRRGTPMCGTLENAIAYVLHCVFDDPPTPEEEELLQQQLWPLKSPWIQNLIQAWPSWQIGELLGAVLVARAEAQRNRQFWAKDMMKVLERQTSAKAVRRVAGQIARTDLAVGIGSLAGTLEIRIAAIAAQLRSAREKHANCEARNDAVCKEYLRLRGRRPILSPESFRNGFGERGQFLPRKLRIFKKTLVRRGRLLTAQQFRNILKPVLSAR